MSEDSLKISELPGYPGGFNNAVTGNAHLPVAVGNTANAKIRVSEIASYIRQSISSNRLVAGDNIRIADNNVISATDTVYDDAEVREQLEDIYTELEAEIGRAAQAALELGARIDAASARIEAVENLGDYAGAFDSYALLPKNASGFSRAVSVNDFATIRSDETRGNAVTRYVVSAIAAGGAIAWTYDVTYSTDISGKQDKLTAGSNIQISGATISATDTIPNNATITLQKNTVTVDSFTANQSANKTINFALAKGDVGLGSVPDVDATNASNIGSGTLAEGRLPNIAIDANTGTGTDITTPAIASNTIKAVIQTVWNKIRQVGNVVGTKADKATVTAATKTKITYNAQGIVTAGADLAASDIPGLDAIKITSGTFADARIASAGTWNAKQNALNGNVNQVVMGNGSYSTGYAEFLPSTALTGVYQNIPALASSIGYNVILDTGKLKGLMIGGSICGGLYFCTIERANASANFAINRPWLPVKARLETLEANVTSVENRATSLESRVTALETAKTDFNIRIYELEERFLRTLTPAQVDSLGFFRFGISFYYVPAAYTASIGTSTHTLYHSLLIVIRNEEYAYVRQLMVPTVYSYATGGGNCNAIYSRVLTATDAKWIAI